MYQVIAKTGLMIYIGDVENSNLIMCPMAEGSDIECIDVPEVEDIAGALNIFNELAESYDENVARLN